MTPNWIRLATRLFMLFADVEEAGRPIDRRVAEAALNGAVGATHAIGVGMTPFDVELKIRDAWILTGTTGARPARSYINNEARNTWDDAAIARLASSLAA